MVIGIKEIGAYIPANRVDNLHRAVFFGVDPEFIKKKIGICSVARMEDRETTSGMCVNAVYDLGRRVGDLDLQDIDLLCVCTENPDSQIPFTAAIVHDVLGLPSGCAAFDINLGCSGYAYSLEIARSFMEMNGLRRGIVLTADPYSRILDPNDKNTELLFGDGATATLLDDNPLFVFGKGHFETIGSLHGALTKKKGQRLYMDGRKIYNFVLRYVPPSINICLDANKLRSRDVDTWIFHQATRFMVESLAKAMKLDPAMVPFESADYGNTIASSIPLLLQTRLHDDQVNTICMSGFGVGLSISSHIITRNG